MGCTSKPSLRTLCYFTSTDRTVPNNGSFCRKKNLCAFYQRIILHQTGNHMRNLHFILGWRFFSSLLCYTLFQSRKFCETFFVLAIDFCLQDSFLIIAVVSGNRKSRHFKINSEVTALSIAGIRVPEMKKAPSIYTVCYIKFIFNYSN